MVGEAMEEYKKIVKNRLSNKRYEHSLGVAETARELAVRNGADFNKAYLAGILHDYAKELSSEELLKIAASNNLITDKVEIKEPQLLHGKVGAYLIKNELGIYDEDILKAIRFHTTGCADMDLLTQIIYIADYIEPNRKFPGVEKMRKTTFINLAQGVFEGLDQTLKYVLEKKGLIHYLSVQARNWLLISGKVK
ncbi:MAG: hypothetical protein PWQ67_174 [Clostridia bacterium]|jgi:predicted HD superfamily hydrolase involved in NAD metabolism|nr:hypothetical protein [Clostridia bacterium]MDN5321720.1 hypothetical protein [Clostridia bacterium]